MSSCHQLQGLHILTGGALRLDALRFGHLRWVAREPEFRNPAPARLGVMALKRAILAGEVYLGKAQVSLLLINDLTRHTATMSADLRQAVERVIASGWYILGAECSTFEQEFAEYCGVAHCIGVGNGTDALELAVRALSIGAGKRVATVANAGCYTTIALNMVGATPVFVDVEAETHLVNLELLGA